MATVTTEKQAETVDQSGIQEQRRLQSNSDPLKEGRFREEDRVNYVAINEENGGPNTD